jgi:hypothetical protein
VAAAGGPELLVLPTIVVAALLLACGGSWQVLWLYSRLLSMCGHEQGAKELCCLVGCGQREPEVSRSLSRLSYWCNSKRLNDPVFD